MKMIVDEKFIVRRMDRDLFHAVKKMNYRDFWLEEKFQREFVHKYNEEKNLIENNVDERRNEDKVKENFISGIIPEIILVSQFNYSFDKKYKDVIDPHGNSVEVKTTSSKNKIFRVLEDVNAKAKDPKYKKSRADHLYIYVRDPKTTIYEMTRTYCWNGYSFA